MSLRLAASVATICACLAATIIGAAVIYGNGQESAAAAGEEINARVTARVGDIVAATQQGLTGTSALFDASEEVEPDEFTAFNRHLLDDPAVTSIAFLEAIDAEERAGWEARNGVEITDIGGEPGATAGQRDRYFPTTLIETEVADPTFGIDLMSNPVRREAIDLAINGGTPIITPPIDLVSGTTGLVMFTPVYEGPTEPVTVAERRAAVAGVVLGVYRTTTLGESIGRGLAPRRWVEITDGGELVAAIGRRGASDDATQGGVNVAGRRWTVRTGPTPTANAWPAVGAAAAGLAITLTIAALLLALGRREKRAQAEARRSTRDAQEAIRARGETEERYATLVATMAGGVLVQDAEGRVVACNAAAEKMLGLTEGELRDPARLATGLAVIDESGRTVEREDQPPYRALSDGVSQPGRILGLAHDDGPPTWVSFTAEPLRDRADEAPRGVVTCFSDITERINADKQLRRERDHWAALIDAMQDGMIHTDADGVITEVNRRFCAMTGFSEEQLVGTGAPYPFWPDDDEALTRLTENLSAGWGGELDTPYRRADGAVLPVIIAASPMRDDFGRLSGVLLTVKDATERERVDRAKDEFVSVVSHELRTPLTSIHGALGVLVEGQGDRLDDTGRNLLNIATRNTERLSHLINHVLDLEQINAGKDGGEFAPARVADLVHQAADLLGPLAAENSVVFDVRPVDADLTVFCDPNRIAQVLTNFLSNAIKFSPGGSTVTLDAARAGSEIEIRVRDQGRGIPADELEKIFERFHQVDSSDRRLAGGAGLGLAISERIAELHGGRVWAESTVDVGSTFILALPATTAVQAPAGAAAESTTPPALL